MTPTATSSPPRCEANARTVATEWGERFIICEGRRGLRSFTDVQGVTRWYCPSLGHKYNVQRRFGKAAEYEVEDGIAAAKWERER